MLSKEDNEAVTATGPGTLMGKLLRQYWIPAALSSELPAPDGDPLRVLLMGEKLIAFRDSQGKVGLIQNHCPHRGASLFFGRNEEAGLRCVYHGWKFDVDGNCVDMPNEPAESNFKSKVRAVAYPCVEQAGVIWAYMGSQRPLPPMPDFEGLNMSEGDYRVSAFQRECNWLQAVEGDIDTCHIGFLHGGHRKPEQAKPGTFSYYALMDRAPKYAVVDTPWGAMYGAYRPAEPGYEYWRIAHFFMPFYSMPPQNILGLPSGPRAWVPIDDTHTIVYTWGVKGSQNWPLQASRSGPASASDNVLGGGSGLLPNSTDWHGRFRLVANERNDYQVDRAEQRSGRSYTGLNGITLQDQAVTESMGAVYDRTTEHLGTSDMMIIRVRRRLLAAARQLDRFSTPPPGVEDGSVYRQRSGGVILKVGADWVKESEKLRQAYAQHPEIDVAIGG